MKLGCVIMAAGESRRFGNENKLLQSFGGQPLYVRALSAVPKDRYEQICVVTGYASVAALAKEMGFLVATNDRPDLGISRTIRIGLEQLTDCDGVLFMTADQPLLSRQTLCRLAETFRQEPQCIVSAAHGGKRGNPCLFPRDLFEALLALEGDTGGSRVIKANGARLRLVEVPEEELADCDTAGTLRELEMKICENFDGY